MVANRRNYEMDICRAIATLCVVATHSFAPYSGSWNIPVNGIYAYKCLGLFSNVFNLCLFVFISGYVLSYQESNRPKIIVNLNIVAKKKAMRLILPCLFWGGQYSLLFGVNILSPRGLFDYFSGLGHLWFLPMLFWVFILFTLLRNKTQISIATIVSLLLIQIVVPNIASLGILSSLHYLFWFICGYYTFIYRDRVKKFPYSFLIVFFMLLLIVSFSYVEARPNMNKLREMGFVYKIIFQIVENSVLLPIAIAGISFVFFLSLWLTSKVDFTISKNWIIKSIGLLSKYSMGIYIFHDFIIEGLYRKTTFLSVFMIYSPWIAFIISILISIVLSKLVQSIPYLRKTI